MKNLEKEIGKIISKNPELIRTSEYHRPGKKYIKLNGKRVYFTQSKLEVTGIYRREYFYEKFFRRTKNFFLDAWHYGDFFNVKVFAVVAGSVLLYLNFSGLERMKNKINEIRSSYSSLDSYSDFIRQKIGDYGTERLPGESISSLVLSNFLGSETIRPGGETAPLRYGKITVNGIRHTSYDTNEPFDVTVDVGSLLASGRSNVEITRYRQGYGTVTESYSIDEGLISRGISGVAKAGNEIRWDKAQGSNKIPGHEINVDSLGRVEITDK